jgi:hypothetical protein
LRAALVGAPRAAREIVARLWLTEGVPSAFSDCPAVYEDLRGWLAPRLAVHPKQITLIGSARAGYSLAPPPDFGRPFGASSDLDLSVVSLELFERVAESYLRFASDVDAGTTVARSAREASYWSENIDFGKRNAPRGFLDPNKVPNFDRYPIAKVISQSMWTLKTRLDATRGAPEITRASVRVYRDWQSLVDRVSLNLMVALAGA